MGVRDDLAGLSEAQLATLGNVGLLKRARREVDAGRGPSITVESDGTLVARSPDGAESRLGVELGQSVGSCTCGAVRACRHRLAAILEYQKQFGQREAMAWDPGTIADDALRAQLGDKLVAAAAIEARSLAVRVLPGATPSAELPNATVSFWAPDALHLARCDCGKRPCAHLAIAVWAFRRKPEGGVAVLGVDAEGEDSLEIVERVLVEIVGVGLAALEDARALVDLRVQLEAKKLPFLVDAVEELERHKERYDRHSTLYRSSAVLRAIAELVARSRAARAVPPPLPPAMLVGAEVGSAGSATDRTRLIALGLEVDADGSRRLASLYFAEPISNTVLALRHDWDFDGKTAPKGPELGKLYPSSRRSLAELSKGYWVARGAQRRASGLLDLRRARQIQPSNAPGAAWDEIGAPILVSSLRAHAARLAEEPPTLLGPRLVGRDVHVLAVGGLRELGYAAAQQEVIATLLDAEGTEFLVRAHYADVAPGRTHALYRALESGVRLVAGRLRQTRRGWELRCLSLVDATDRIVVPDLEPVIERAMAPRPELLGDEPASLFTELSSLSERGAHQGLAALRESLHNLADRFERSAMLEMAALTRAAVSSPRGFLDLIVASELAIEAALRP